MMYKLFYYTQYDGAWTISDSNISAIWNRMVSEGADKKVFYSDPIDTAEKFITYLKSNKTFPFFVFKGNTLNIESVAAIVWCTNIRVKCAQIHFCVFKEHYGDGMRLSQSVFKYIFNIKSRNEYVVDCIRGETPKFNRMAIKYLHTIGMNIIGEIPAMAYNKYTKKICPMVISYMSYENYRGQNEQTI